MTVGAIGTFVIGTSAIGVGTGPWPPSVPGPKFFAVELEAYKPGATTLTTSLGHGTHPRGTLALLAETIESAGVIRASDAGYRTSPYDAGGVVTYPPLLNDAFQINNQMRLEVDGSSAAAAWGAVVLSNPQSHFDGIASSWNSDGRAVRVLYGHRGWDRQRQYLTDPAHTDLGVVFKGVATPWFLSDTDLKIPLRDATYWLERPYQTNLYTGAGGYNGTAALTGKPIPRTRGGTREYPCRNVTPTLLDPVNRVYQYSDGPAAVINLYEGGAPVILRAGDTTDLYYGATPPGYYRTDNSRALFQLGSAPVNTITADVIGSFPVGGAVTTVAGLIGYMLLDDMLLPGEHLDLASFLAADAAYPYTGAAYFGSETPVSGLEAVDFVARGWGAKLVAFRDGTLRLLVLRALAAGVSERIILSPDNLISLVPVALPPSLDPPPFRVRVQYAANYTVQTSGLNLASVTDAQAQYAPLTGLTAAWSSGANLLAYRRPNDPPLIAGALQVLAQAQAVADGLGALWGVRRRLYDATLPLTVGIALDIGDVVKLRWLMDDLVSGRLGQIVGYVFQARNSTITFRILI